jgi:hypothetical protein
MKPKPIPTHFRVLKECWNQDTRQRLKAGDIISGLSAFEVGRNLAEGNIVAHNEPIVPRVGHVIETQMVAAPEIRMEPEQKPKSIFARRGRPKK